MEIEEKVIEGDSPAEVVAFIKSRIGKTVAYKGDVYAGRLRTEWIMDNEHVEVIAEIETEMVEIEPMILLYNQPHSMPLRLAVKYTLTTETGKRGIGYVFFDPIINYA